jgi:hypothetical protein
MSDVPVVALMYDFDRTLCTKDMQDYSFIPSLGLTEQEFWSATNDMWQREHMDSVLAYMYAMVKLSRGKDMPLRRETLVSMGKNVELFRGVDSWFDRITAFGQSLGVQIEHYVISSGMAEIIEASSIADEFRRIYACRYYYDENGTARWPAQIINYTTKTQYIFRINKQVLDESDDESLNAWVPQEQRPIPFSRMVYIADGLTDVPCMKLVKEYGGKSIVVYNPESAKAGITASRLIRENRADFMSVADYRESHDLETLVKLILDHMAADSRLEDLEGRYR